MGILNKVIKNKMIKAGSWYTLTNFFLKGLSFLTIPIFTRILTPSDYGVVSLYTTWLSFVIILIGLGLNESIRQAKFDYTNQYNEFVSSICFLSLIIFSIFLVFFIIFREEISFFMDLPVKIFIFMIFQAFFTQIYSIALTEFRIEYKYKIISIIGLGIAISSVIVSVYFIEISDESSKFIGKIIGGGIPIVLVGIVLFIYLLYKGKEFINPEYWKYGLSIGLPLIFHSLGLILNAQIDRVIINKYWGSSITGLYSFAYQLGLIVQVLFSSIDQAWNPWFLENFRNNNFIKIKYRARIMRNIFTVLFVTGLFLSPEIVQIMANEKYWDALVIVPYIFMAGYFMFMYALEVNVEYACKNTKLIAFGTIFSAIINIVLNIIFVPIFGYIAAAVTTLVSYYILFLFHFYITSKKLKINIYGWKFHGISTFLVVLATVYFLIFKYMIFFRILGILVSWSIFYIWYRNNKKKDKY